MKIKKPYTHIFFDLDHTLWDFDKNSTETLHELYNEFGLKDILVGDVQSFIEKFMEVNYELWDLYDDNKIEKEDIRDRRFPMIFQKMNATSFELCGDLAVEYIDRCPRRGYLLKGTIELLEYLSGKYQLHIITNGFPEIQDIKLSTSGIGKYFDQIITSESTGFKKPHKAIFEYALQVTAAKKETSVMVGDSLKSDVFGAISYGMDCIFLNTRKARHFQPVVLEVQCLTEIHQKFRTGEIC